MRVSTIAVTKVQFFFYLFVCFLFMYVIEFFYIDINSLNFLNVY
jgi:hypothetical protein